MRLSRYGPIARFWEDLRTVSAVAVAIRYQAPWDDARVAPRARAAVQPRFGRAASPFSPSPPPYTPA